jgi:hypothetical protein
MAKKYIYEHETVPLTPDQIQALQMQLLTPDSINAINMVIQSVLAKRGEDGWKVLSPINLPTLWFEKEQVTRKKANG